MKFLRNSFLVLALTAATALTPVAAKENRTAPHDTEHTTDFPQLTLANWAPRLRNYLKKNYRFIVKRLAREVGYRKVMEYYKKSGHTFQDEFVDGAAYSVVAATLDSTLPTDEEDWIVAVFIAGLVDYVYEQKGLGHSAAAATKHYLDNYLLDSPIAQQMGNYAPLLHTVSFFSDGLTEKDTHAPQWNFAKGLASRIGYFAAWNDETRVPTSFKRGSFGDRLLINFLACALIPATISDLEQRGQFKAFAA